jgi:hypothetical protein
MWDHARYRPPQGLDGQHIHAEIDFEASTRLSLVPTCFPRQSPEAGISTRGGRHQVVFDILIP